MEESEYDFDILDINLLSQLSQLKNEMERINNGFESTVLNLNANLSSSDNSILPEIKSTF